MDTYLTVDEAARALRLSRATVYKLIARGAVRAVRHGDSPKAALRIAEDELDRYTLASTIGSDLAYRAEQLVARRGEDPGDAKAYTRALQDLGYEDEVFADRVRLVVQAEAEDAHRRGYIATAANTSSDVVDIEKIVLEELRKLPDPLPVGVTQLGASGLGKKALQILRKAGVTEYNAATYRKAIQQAIRDAVSAKRKV